MTANSYKKIALIGGIASGKSVVSGIMSELGAYIIDADVVAREVVAHGTAGEKKLIKAFPTCVVDGAVDRRKLRELVFSDKTMLEKLNGITHPLIKKAHCRFGSRKRRCKRYRYAVTVRLKELRCGGFRLCSAVKAYKQTCFTG